MACTCNGGKPRCSSSVVIFDGVVVGCSAVDAHRFATAAERNKRGEMSAVMGVHGDTSGIFMNAIQ